MKEWLVWFWDEFGPPLMAVATVAVVVCIAVWALYIITGQNKRSVRHLYEVEAFTTDLTIRIQCSGDCDLAAMIAEAREAAEK